MAVKLQTSNLALNFADQPPNAINIRNLLTNRDCCVNGSQSFMIRSVNAVSEPIMLSHLEKTTAADDQMRLKVTDGTNKNSVLLEITAGENGLVFNARVVSESPIWMLEWSLTGLQLDEIIIPGLGGQVINASMPDGESLAYKYPFWWNAQFIVGSQQEGGLWLHNRDNSPDQKILRIKRNNGSFTVTWGTEAPAPCENHELEMEWFLDGYSGDWQNPVESFRTWLETAYNLSKLVPSPRYPKWMEDKNIILEIWGAQREFEQAANTFVQMQERLIQWSKIHPPENTMVYLPAFAEHGIDSHAPDYNPSPLCGGPDKFRELIATAHDMGYHVIVHTNVLAMTYSHRLFPEFQQYQVTDPFGRKQGWGMDIDGDWLAEPFFAYINPGNRAWGDLMTNVIGELIEKYRVDGVFLDQTLLSFNESRGPNFMVGMVSHIRRLQNEFPGVLFAGEGLHEFNLCALPMAQIHGIDSVAGVHAIDTAHQWRNIHPISVYLFQKYTRLAGHLLTKNPADPIFQQQEKAYAMLNIIPVIALYNSSQHWDYSWVKEVLKRARELND